MANRKLLSIFIFLFVILFINLVSADFSVGNKSHAIDKKYGQSEAIRGWINISLNNEPSNSLFQDSRNGSIQLIDLLKANGNSTYSCSPLDCSKGYASTNGETSKTFNFSSTQSKTLGLRFSGNINQINSVSFSLNSDAAESCGNQISLDILNDGEVDVINNKPGAIVCSNQRSYGCYSSSIEKEDYTLAETSYCQKINLSNSQGFKIGAFIKKNSGSRVLEAAIFDGGSRGASCILSSVSGDVGEYSCDVNYPVTSSKEYFVCVSSISGSGDYKIVGNPSPVQGCGFFGIPPPTSTPGAYEIFAEGKGFGPVGSIQVQNSLPDGKSFGSMVYNYILGKYGNSNCSPECVVPIKFSGLNQQVTVSGLSVNYQKTTGVVAENKFYDLTETPAKISSGFRVLSLNSGGFSVPDSIGNYKFSLKLNNKDVFSEDVNVTDTPKILSLSPTSTASLYPTDFVAAIGSNSIIKKFFWDFGDNKTQITTTGTARYTYDATGSYKITLTVIDTRDLTSSKTFDINVSSPKNLINTSIVKTKVNLDKIKSQTAGFDAFSQTSIHSVLGISNSTQEIALIEASYNSAQNESEYGPIINRLLKLKTLPKSVTQGTTASSITFFPDRESINLDVIQKVAGGEYNSDNQEGYIDAVIAWNYENIDSKVTFKEFIGNYEGDFRPVVRVFEMDVINKGSTGDTYYLIMPKLENLGFESSVSAVERDGYVYVDMTNRETISFYTTEDVDFTNIPAVISPSIGRLSVSDVGSSILPEERPKWLIFVIVIIFLAIIAFIVYIILQEWYKRKYENYLFKNRNDLYNIVNYIHHSKKKGMHNKDIAENLRKAKWHHEQIAYVMKKYAGERTGMFEIPITKLFQKNPEHPGNHPGHQVSRDHKKL